MAAEPLAIAIASRPVPGESANGDGYLVSWHDGCCRLIVIDGLGHGGPAAEATEAARAVLSARPELEPVAALEACHRALAGTRGAAMAAAWLDIERGRLSYAGIGNVEARVWQDG